MEFPLPLRTAIEQKAQDSSTAELIREAQGLSQRYREESGQGKRLVTTDRQAFVYAAVRMPATFGAVAAALEHTLPFLEDAPTSLLDVGAGTGAAAWAGGLPAVVGIGFLPGTGARYGPARPIIDVRRQRTAAKSPLDPRRSHRQKSAPGPRRTGECGLCAQRST